MCRVPPTRLIVNSSPVCSAHTWVTLEQVWHVLSVGEYSCANLTVPWMTLGQVESRACDSSLLEKEMVTGAVLPAPQCVSHPSCVAGRALVALMCLAGGQLWAHQSPGQGAPARGVTSGSVLTGEAVAWSEHSSEELRAAGLWVCLLYSFLP